MLGKMPAYPFLRARKTRRESVGGVGGRLANPSINSTNRVAGASRGAVGGLNAGGQLTSNNRGAFGLNGLSLNSAVAHSTLGSAIAPAECPQLQSEARLKRSAPPFPKMTHLAGYRQDLARGWGQAADER